MKRPAGPVVDGLGALLVGARRYRSPGSLPTQAEDDPEGLKGVLLKLRPDQVPTILGSGFEEVRALALDPQGNLYVATDEAIYRLRAPAVPAVAHPPQFTNQSPLSLRGTAAPDSEITALGGQAPATTQAEPLTGAFTLSVPLTPDAENRLRIYATSVQGRGLTSAPTEATVLHDSRPPTVHVTKPAPGAFVRGSVDVAGEATETMREGEAWSGVASLTLEQGETVLTTAANPTPESPNPHAASALWDTSAVPDGSYVLTATATDRAGNTATDRISVTVDNTPPTVTITAPGAGDIVRGVVEVRVIAADATAGVEALALYVDGTLRTGSGLAFLTYALDTRSLAPGPHTLTATATDRAGNQASTTRGIIVQNLTVRITAPLDGTSLTQDRVQVTGTVDGQGEIGVVVNGILAFITGTQWVADIPLALGSNLILVTATDTTGVQDTKRITVTVSQATPAPVLLRANVDSGVSPLVVTWQLINQTGHPLVRFEFDPTGTGSFGPPTSTFDGTQTMYSTPGVFSPALRATDDQGTTYNATTLLQVEDPQAVTARFQGRWNNLKASLQAGDIAGALGHLSPGLQARFRVIFQQLAADLPAIVASLGSIEVLEQIGDLAEAVIVQH